MRRSDFLIANMALLALISAHAGLAQTAASEILGRVTDATSAGVVGAKVTDTHVATGHVQTQMTNQDGDYTFALVDIGEHTVKVEKEGFLARTPQRPRRWADGLPDSGRRNVGNRRRPEGSA